MRCQSRNRRSSRRCAFSARRPSRSPSPSSGSLYRELLRRLEPPQFAKDLLHCLNDSSAKIFLSFRRQRASILVSHARNTNTLFPECHLYYAPISKWCLDVVRSPEPQRQQLLHRTEFAPARFWSWTSYADGCCYFSFQKNGSAHTACS